LRFFFVLLLLAGLAGRPSLVLGQSGSAAFFTPPDYSRFPSIQFHLDVFDAEGSFAQGLGLTDIQLIEDGKVLTPESVELLKTGLQVIVVLNTSPVLSTKTNNQTEYERLVLGLQDWAKSIPAETLDDFSLSTPTGLFLIRAREPAKFEHALTEFQPDLVKTQPSLTSLSEALDLATDPLGRPLMKRSILYITPSLPTNNIASLPDLALRAQEIGVRVNVWQVGPGANTGEGTPDPLQTFAESTGGKYFRVLPGIPLPEMEPVFQPQRSTYAIQYRSGIQKSGSHSLSVQANLGSSSASTAEQRFDLAVEPPNPIFLTPPLTVQRSWTVPTQKEEAPALLPDVVPLQILVEFSDQHPRPLKATRLYADGVLVSENTQEPFDRFDWSIAGKDIPARSVLRVEAVDSLDLVGASSEITVEILVDLPVKTSLFDRLSERGMIAVSAMVAAGAALALVLALTNTQRRARWKRQMAARKLEKDPVTQPVKVQPLASRPARTGFWKRREAKSTPIPTWPRASVPNAPARLLILDENEQPVTGGILPLSRQEITFGSDPKRATQVLNSPTVDGLHARLYRNEQEEFFLADQNSIAGTWINYAPVTPAGAHLEHGDLIHIGKVMFRFELTDPSRVPPVEVKVIDLEQPHDPQ
jgi:hypothetical protein